MDEYSAENKGRIVSERQPVLTTIEKDKHYRVTNTTESWVNVELTDWDSGFRSVSNLAPGACLDFFPTKSSETVQVHWTATTGEDSAVSKSIQ